MIFSQILFFFFFSQRKNRIFFFFCSDNLSIELIRICLELATKKKMSLSFQEFFERKKERTSFSKLVWQRQQVNEVCLAGCHMQGIPNNLPSKSHLLFLNWRHGWLKRPKQGEKEATSQVSRVALGPHTQFLALSLSEKGRKASAIKTREKSL